MTGWRYHGPMANVHATAVVSGECELADGVVIGPYCTLRGRVTLGPGVELIAGVHLSGPITIGAGTRIWPGASLGFGPQDYKFKPGDPTAGVVIGSGCLIRENVTIHASTKPDAPTRVGDRCFLMVGTHLAHDARIGNDVIMVNGAGLAGHAEVGDNATLSGGAIVHQFTRIGRMAFMSGGTGVSMDVPPFCVVVERNRLGGINLVGMRRAGIPRDHITRTRRAFSEVFRRVVPREEALSMLLDRAEGCPPVAELAEFVRTTKRSICPGMGKPPRVLTTWLQARRAGRSVGDLDDDGLDSAGELSS